MTIQLIFRIFIVVLIFFGNTVGYCDNYKYLKIGQVAVGHQNDKKNIKKIRCRLTAYNPTKRQCGKNSEPKIRTAFGKIKDNFINNFKIIAISRDLEKKGLKKGSIVFIPCLNEYRMVYDRTDKRLRNTVDIRMQSYSKAIEFGIQYDTIILFID